MDSFTIDNILVFILFFLPGFLSVKFFQLVEPTGKIDIANSVFEIIGYSCLNHFIFSWVIYLNIKYDWLYKHNTFFFLSLILVVIVGPILLSYCYYKISISKFFNKYATTGVSTPWDDFFKLKKSCYVVITLKDEGKIGGYYGTQSSSSVYPKPNQIYIQDVWLVDEKNKFLKKKPKTFGIIINMDEAKYIEFYKP